MKLVDLNVLIYATDSATRHHTSAKTWLDRAMTGTETIGLPTSVTVGYVRITTNPRIMKSPLAVGRAVDMVRIWLARPNVTTPQPTDRHYGVLEELLNSIGVGGNLVSDAHLAALAIEHGAALCTFDTDFARFPGLVTDRPE